MTRNDIVLYIGPQNLPYFNPEGERIENITGPNKEFATIKGRLLPLSDLKLVGDQNWLHRQLHAVRNHLQYCLEERTYYSKDRRREVIDSCEFIYNRLTHLAKRLYGNDSVQGFGLGQFYVVRKTILFHLRPRIVNG